MDNELSANHIPPASRALARDWMLAVDEAVWNSVSTVTYILHDALVELPVILGPSRIASTHTCAHLNEF